MSSPEHHTYVLPTKEIKLFSDVQKWIDSEAYREYVGFIVNIGECIKGLKITDSSIHVSDAASKILEVLDVLYSWVSDIPLVEESQQRFGNSAFKIWCDRLIQKSDHLLEAIIPNTEARKETLVYFVHGFGNSTRIDYGTGHEMAFVMFLCSLYEIKILEEKDKKATGLLIFAKYMNLVRYLQTHYKLEPAGSQGVWSLDDYQFVPFIWGSAQLIGNRVISPKSIGNYETAKAIEKDFHLFACINYISQVKTGPFPEHSNQLWNISAVPVWEKVNSGLIKMYKAEVLSKFPVIQHVYFGSIFTLKKYQNE